MELKLSKCARCNKLYNKILSDVCIFCQPDEDQDFIRIREVLTQAQGYNALQVAQEAGVTIDCVIRMLREGRISNVAHNEEATCGRCGAPAISKTKRLCRRCLTELDRECAHAMMEMRQRIHGINSSEMNDVTAAVVQRRTSRRQQRREAERPVVAAPQTAETNRMVVPLQRRKTPGTK